VQVALKARRRSVLKRTCRVVACLAAATVASMAGTRGTQDAIANGDTRSLTLLHTHTNESATITFRRNGRYDSEALNQLNWLLRDWRLDRPAKMDPRLFDIVWEVYREVGAREPIHVLSAYRAPETNAMLRRRSRGVSEHSQHMAGKAMDFRLPDADMARVRAIAMRLQHGGVGYYPGSGFVHLDAGSVRAWPRMTQDQLARLFPDGKTVHLPATGKPLPRYEEARAEILARGGAVAGYAAADGGGTRRSLWATLFGGDDEDAEYYGARQGGRAGFASRNVSAYAPAQNDDSPIAALMNSRSPQRARTEVAAADTGASSGFRFFWQKDPAPEPPVAAAEPLPVDEPLQTGALAPMPPPRPAEIMTAAVDAPVPPARPSELAFGLAVLAAKTAARTSPAEDDRAALKALFGTAATASPPSPPARPIPIATSRAKPQPIVTSSLAGPGPALDLGFSSTPTGDLTTTAFTGPAVKPLPVLR
jgi:uncharacterized protein YcbK (DUF882 family)